MYNLLLIAHSYIRYVVLILLVIVIIKSLLGWLNKKAYHNTDDKLSLFLFISTHTQLLVGLILYFISPFVAFGSETMKDKFTRYWTVEHLTGMAVAIVLISVARISAKKMQSAEAKHKRIFLYNLIALLVIIVMISLSGRRIL